MLQRSTFLRLALLFQAKHLAILKKERTFAPAIQDDGGIAQLVRAHDS